ncbi:MAG: hypothetical protein IJS46_06730 [Kiritimatiellae bacterium]|nr:hypothetical protein [Kiritimatiellia bacterium]
MQRKSSFPAFAAALAALVAGCEWTSTSSSDSWSGSYDAMNFAGTYRSSASLTSSSGESDGSPVAYSESIGSISSKSFSGKLSKTPVVPGSVVISVSDGFSYHDDSAANIVDDNGNTVGAISYSGGGVSLSFSGQKTGSVSVSYSYYPGTTTAGTDAATSDSTLSNISSITVSQSGQNLSMTTNTGLKMSGKFTAVRQTSGTEDSTVKTFNAQFQVSSSNGYTFVGTLNHDLSSGYCTLNGTITKGKAAADVQGIGPAYNAG